MRPPEGMGPLREAMRLVHVFGEPCERDSVTVLPVAVVRGGAGGGTGTKDQLDEGGGVAFGVLARPVGVYVLTDGRVEWVPAVDVNRIVTVAVLRRVIVAWLVSRALG